MEYSIDDGHEFIHYISNNDATCLSDGTQTATCEMCCKAQKTITLENSSGHLYGEWIGLDDGTHIRICDRDDSHFEIEPCMGGNPTKDELAICSVCGNRYGEYVSSDEGTDEPESFDTTCNHMCHKDNFFVKIWWRIVKFFQRIFNISEYCNCGQKHY